MEIPGYSDLREIGRRLRRELHETRAHMDRIMATLMEIAEPVMEAGESREDCVIAGQTNLMDFNEFASMDRLRMLFDAFTEKHEILHLLDQCMHAQGVQISSGVYLLRLDVDGVTDTRRVVLVR